MLPIAHRLSLVSIAAALMFASALAQAQVKTPKDMSIEADQLIKQILKAKTDQKDKLADRLHTFLAPLLNKDTGCTTDHYVFVSERFLRAEIPEIAVMVCDKGIEKFPDSRFLYDNRGLAHLVEFNQADTLDEENRAARAARDDFRKALTFEPDTYHAHAGLAQSLECLGDYGPALEAWEKALAFKDLPHAELHRKHGTLLMRNGRMSDAAAAFAKSRERGEPDAHAARILEMRSLLLAGERERAVAAARASLTAREPRHESLLLAAVDVCAEASDGKTIDLLDRLMATDRTLPPANEDESPADVIRHRGEARAALRVLFTEAGKALPAALRESIRKAVGHQVLMQGLGAQKELENHPLLVFLLCEHRDWSEKAWAEELLVALCAHSILEAAPSDMCRNIATAMAGEEIDLGALLEPEELRSRITGLEKTIFDPTFPAAFAARRLMRQLTNARPGDEKKSPKSPSK
ncbi:MAG: hypothetical protein H6832_02170 [Planctomycetes bacterium]|nr:hypothetical protein [Planctomycetota bacterium]